MQWVQEKEENCYQILDDEYTSEKDTREEWWSIKSRHCAVWNVHIYRPPLASFDCFTGEKVCFPHRWESGESIIPRILAQICPHCGLYETVPGINKSEPPPPRRFMVVYDIKWKLQPWASITFCTWSMHNTCPFFILYLYAIASFNA